MVQEDRRRRGRRENYFRSNKRSKLMPLPTIDEHLSASWDGVGTCDDVEERGNSSSVCDGDDVLSRLVAEFQSKTSSSYNAPPHQIKIDDGGEHDNETSPCESSEGSSGNTLENDETPDVLSQLVTKFQAEAGNGRPDTNLKTSQARIASRDDRPTEEERAKLLLKCTRAAERVFAATSLTLDQLKEYESICSSACSRLLDKERSNDSKS